MNLVEGALASRNTISSDDTAVIWVAVSGIAEPVGSETKTLRVKELEAVYHLVINYAEWEQAEICEPQIDDHYDELRGMGVNIDAMILIDPGVTNKHWQLDDERTTQKDMKGCV